MTASCLALALAFSPAPADYKAQIEDWRAQREAELKADDGWLTVAGLSWLHVGDNAAGNNPDAAVVLPRGLKSIGVFRFEPTGKTIFVPTAGAAIYWNRTPLKG